MVRDYVLKGKYIADRRKELLPVIREAITKLYRYGNLPLTELYDLQHFSLEFMRNENTWHVPESYETRLDTDPSDPQVVKHYCILILQFLDCKEDRFNEKLPCRTCIEAISMYLGAIILQYEDRMSYRH